MPLAAIFSTGIVATAALAARSTCTAAGGCDGSQITSAFGNVSDVLESDSIWVHTTQEVLRAAGEAFSPDLAATAGVYVGCMYTEYLDGVLAGQGLADGASAAVTGHGLSFLVGRVSYTFGLQVLCHKRALVLRLGTFVFRHWKPSSCGVQLPSRARDPHLRPASAAFQ